MSDQLRYARLTGSMEPEVPGGGIPLPGAFHDVLYYLLNNGRSALEDVLAKVVRDSIGELHDSRVRHVWGSWDSLTGDLLDQLEEREFVMHRGAVWSLSSDFRGGRVRILYYPGDYPRGSREMRVTVRSREEHEKREVLAKARSRMQDYRQQLEAWGLYEGNIGATIDQHMASLHWDDRMIEEEDDLRAPPPNATLPYGAVAAFARKYLREMYPKWVTSTEVARAFNAAHPEGRQIPGHQPFDRLMILVSNGLAVREVDEVHQYKGRPKVLFQWIPQGD